MKSNCWLLQVEKGR